MSKDETTPIDAAAPADADLQDDARQPTASDETTLTTAQQQAKEYFDGWQRERADFANYKKRIEREMKELHQQAAISTLVTLLPIVDDFERAMHNVPAEIEANAWLDGVRGIQRKLNKLLTDHGIEAIDPVGEAFDPNHHEAIGMEDSTEVASGHVTTTLQKGYIQGNRVLRPALVRVAN